MAEPQNQKRDLNLAEGFYAYLQDNTKGSIKVYNGPTVVNPTAQETPVRYDTTSGDYIPCQLEQAKCKSVSAAEGQYVILKNPDFKNKQPEIGTTQIAASLDKGRTVVIPGPVDFALWPGQIAKVVNAHQLRSNQYLVVRVVNEEQAKKNWGRGVMKPAAPPATPTQTSEGTGEQPQQPQPAPQPAPQVVQPPDLIAGQLLIIKGTEVSFYIPPTGIEVLLNPDADGEDPYVRDALTLERLDYAILVDENGTKRFEKGPSVVFPEPTERFIETEEKGVKLRKFRAIELNPIQAIHIKVIAEYEENGKKFVTGEELFITGKDTQIYYPREEHSAIKYDGRVKHFATAVPAGEARYVLNRLTGIINTVVGPAMLLPDPRHEVIVRRVLSDKQCLYWYPGNVEVLNYNQKLRSVLANVPTTRAGAISEGDYERGTKGAQAAARSMEKRLLGEPMSASGYVVGAASTQSFMESSGVSRDQKLVGEEFSRANTYTEPRSITLDTKFQGAPTIDVWTGYAVMVVSKTGKRQVAQGPKTILLGYDETLEVLEMSTGKPKTTDNLLRTVYLRTENNKVADIINVETADHVFVEVKVSYLVDFKGDPLKWFSVENYVKYLCDHVRSMLKGAVRKIKVEDFYNRSTDFIRDIILGASKDGSRSGLSFQANGMVVSDVEVLGITISNDVIRQLLEGTQHKVVRSTIELAELQRNLELEKVKHEVTRQTKVLVTETEKQSDELAKMLAESKLSVTMQKLANQLAESERQIEVDAKAKQIEDERVFARLNREKAIEEQRIELAAQTQEQLLERLEAETKAVVGKLTALKDGYGEILGALSDKELVGKIAEAQNLLKLVHKDSSSEELINNIVGLRSLKDMIAAGLNGAPNGAKQVTPTVPTPPKA